MTPSDPWKRYLDAGIEVTNLTRRRAEKIVKDFVKEGTLRGEQAQERVEELLERSRKASEHLVAVVSAEVARQMETLGLVQPTTPIKKAASAAKKSASAAKKSTTGAAKKSTAAAKKAVKSSAATAKKATGRS